MKYIHMENQKFLVHSGAAEKGAGAWPPTLFRKQNFLHTGYIPCLEMFHLPVEVSTYFWATYRQVFSKAVILRIKLWVYDDRLI